jgi:hypothetical protein
MKINKTVFELNDDETLFPFVVEGHVYCVDDDPGMLEYLQVVIWAKTMDAAAAKFEKIYETDENETYTVSNAKM